VDQWGEDAVLKREPIFWLIIAVAVVGVLVLAGHAS
jgi:hypothetical protein